MNNNAMATCKLAEGIRGFSADIVKLEKIVRERLGIEPVPSPVPAIPPKPTIAKATGGVTTTPANEGGGRADTEFDQLAGMTTIVAGSGEIEAIRQYNPTDATTNPSLIYAAAQMLEYANLVDDAVSHAAAAKGEEVLSIGRCR